MNKIFLVLFLDLFLGISLCFASNQVYKDTFSIQLKGKTRVLIVGNSFDEINKYHKIDTVKALLINEYFQQNHSGIFPKNICLIYAKNGRSKLEIFPPNSSPNIEEDKETIKNDMPEHHFVIYDVSAAIEIHFYLEDQNALEDLKSTFLRKSIQDLGSAPKMMDKAYYIHYSQNDTGFIFTSDKHKRSASFYLVPDLGLVLVGNKLSPTINVDICANFFDKYGYLEGQLGFNFQSFYFEDIINGVITNYNTGGLINIFLMANNNPKHYFLSGMEGGVFLMRDENGKLIFNGFDFGFRIKTRMVSTSLDFAAKSLVDKKGIILLSLHLPFEQLFYPHN